MGKLTAIDLFCGAGGLSNGFEQAGFRVLAGNDISDVAGETFSRNHAEASFIGGPVEDIRAARLLRVAGLKRGELTCLVGGPPCQGFSVYNHQRGMHDQRSHLFKEYLRLVDGLQPQWIVMENVTGLLSIDDGGVIEQIARGFDELGYQVKWKILKAEDYDVPQERRRIVFIGNRTGQDIIFPDATHGPGLQPFVTIEDAIVDLPVLANGGKLSEGVFGVRNHTAPRLSDINLRRMKFISQGGSWRDIPVELLPEGMKRAKRSDHTKRYGRMKWNGLSCTILTKCDVHWGAYIHPEQDRAISVREAARLQSFADDFVFKGSMTDHFVQVENSVPPLLAKRIADAVLRSTSSTSQARDVGQRVRLVA
jgi:DNA (cytosine-5)-methyltransferase 1